MGILEIPTASVERPGEMPFDYFEPRWYAAWIRSRHEKTVAQQLERKSVETFLPVYETVRQWKNSRHRVRLPLFPGYAFVRIALRDRLEVLKVPGVVRLVGFNGTPTPLGDEEIESLRQALAPGVRAEPHPFLTVGRRVRITAGPLADREGILVRRKATCAWCSSIELIRRAMVVDLDIAEVGPRLSRCGALKQQEDRGRTRDGYSAAAPSENGRSRAHPGTVRRFNRYAQGIRGLRRYVQAATME